MNFNKIKFFITDHWLFLLVATAAVLISAYSLVSIGESIARSRYEKEREQNLAEIKKLTEDAREWQIRADAFAVKSQGQKKEIDILRTGQRDADRKSAQTRAESVRQITQNHTDRLVKIHSGAPGENRCGLCADTGFILSFCDKCSRQ